MSQGVNNTTTLGVCKHGTLFPVWEPNDGLDLEDRALRGAVYFLALLYMFLGVSIVSDRFMAAIEVITAREKEIKLQKPNGEVQVVVVRIWNETVANLTLMALGSSAPEILLSIIEIIGGRFEAGELGPGTIVGSAAFNLLIIIGICILVIPNGEIRRIKHLRVFFVTATWSVFAYVWLLIILKVSSPGEVEIWEAVVTFLFFPLTVGSAYIADKRMLVYKYLSKSYRADKRGLIIEGEGGGSLTDVGKSDTELKRVGSDVAQDDVTEYEQSRRDYIQLLRLLRKKNPDFTPAQIEDLARQEIVAKGPKSRAFYRMQATRQMVGGHNLVKKMQEKSNEEKAEFNQKQETMKILEEAISEKVTRIFFDPAHYSVLENVGKFKVNVAREGGDLTRAVQVVSTHNTKTWGEEGGKVYATSESIVSFKDYHTEDGTANAGSDYFAVIGTLTFEPNVKSKTVTLEVINDEEYEEDEHFYLKLSQPRFSGPGPGQGQRKSLPLPTPSSKSRRRARRQSTRKSLPTAVPDEPTVVLGSPNVATIIILDDDFCGIFNFAEKAHDTSETAGVLELKVSRWSGARGKVSLKYRTVDGTACAGRDFEGVEGVITFNDNVIEDIIRVKLIDSDSYVKDLAFYVEISDPRLLDGDSQKIAALKKKNPNDLTREEQVILQGLPRLGNDIRLTVHIRESHEFKDTIDRLVQQTNEAALIGSSSWKEQFHEAFCVGETGESMVAGIATYIIHFLTMPWKILFAFIPPTDIFGGYLAFCCSIVFIGLLTAVIGDMASHFGCSVGLKDTVTSIVFVALGTSIPDTFASKVAAVQDEFADASIGNVTGSNAVNVFLGIGIAWSLAAVYHEVNSGSKFLVDPGSLGFSVTLFCACAFVAILALLLRRLEIFGGGELGGPKRFKIPTGILFVSLWLFYVIMSSLESYKHIQGF